MLEIMQNNVVEWSYENDGKNIDLSAEVTDPENKTRKLFSFLGGDNKIHFRYSSPVSGTHTVKIFNPDGTFNGKSEEITVTPYSGENSLYQHGPIKVSDNNKHFIHNDGKPFFYLADTWWYALTKRIQMGDGFEDVIADRVEKGFNAIQLCVGMYPEMLWHDEVGVNEAGYPWTEDMSEINPAYFDEADRKIQCIVEAGLVPFIVGSWGHHAFVLGTENMNKHWKNIIARWSAYPVMWCLSGEATQQLCKNRPGEPPVEFYDYVPIIRQIWTDIGRYVRANDPFNRLITMHSRNYGTSDVLDESILDFDCLQTGHSAYNSMLGTIQICKTACERRRMPVINDEVCYEGICGSSGADIIRYSFLVSFCIGTIGHGYGANGIWQMNTPEAPFYNPRNKLSWGNTTWKDAYKLPGSRQAGNIKKLIEKLDWWNFRPHPEWLEKHCNYENLDNNFACGSDETRFIFAPFLGKTLIGALLMKKLEKNVDYYTYLYNPIDHELIDCGITNADERGECRTPMVTLIQDWVVVMSKKKISL